MSDLIELRKELKSMANSQKAKDLQRFFKTGKGDYGEGDIFLGVVVPEQRKITKKYAQLNLEDIRNLLYSKIHEERLIALLILVDKYKKSNNESEKRKIFDFYLANSRNINNWDLVDLSAPNIVGDFLLNRKDERKILYKLAKSENIWERRIAVLATFTFIRNHDFEDSLNLSESLLKDEHDLIHKAVGWMLREIGKRDENVLEEFLKRYYEKMPRTMLRYSIEKFSKERRQKYLEGEI
ncbi:MAG: DNA alkylation repair protein [Candidatus Pacearchaeota archaeon]|jgi:3-methyladenine DNA glycosylase AlkD